MIKQKAFIPVALAVIIFLVSQVLIVRQVWKQKDELFKLKYRSVARDALTEMAKKTGDSGFEKAFYIFDGAAELYYNDIMWLNTGKDSVEFASKVRRKAESILEKDQMLSVYIAGAFKKIGLETGFDYRIVINDLYLLSYYDKYPISASGLKEPMIPEGYILVNTFFSEGNHFRISFDYYIDVSNKKKILFREVSLTLLLSLLSLVILSLIFVGTLKNYLKEKRLSNLKTDFINNMTHELKTPLSTITVAGKTLKLDEILNDRTRIIETASLIGKQSIHLNNLINLILEISMWERSQFQVDLRETVVEELLRDITAGFKNGCGKECRFSESYATGGALARIDSIYFTTMIDNLLNNALKYSPDNPEISVNVTVTDTINISVEDNGIGISRTSQKHLFDKFFRVSSGNLHSTKGLGLGLYYVKKIAEAHGGTVSVCSKPGKGSVFTVCIPKI